MHAVFVCDPERNVTELDAYAGKEPETRDGGQSVGCGGTRDARPRPRLRP